MNTLMEGHIKWAEGRPADAAMGLVADGFQPRTVTTSTISTPTCGRSARTASVRIPGSRRPCWCSSRPRRAARRLYLLDVDGRRARRDGALCEAHGRATEDAGQYPVVTLAVDSYEHRVKSYGKVKVPVFKLCGAVEAGPFDAIVAGARGGAGFLPKSPSLERSSIAVAIGRAAPEPPLVGPPAPPRDAYDGSTSGGTEGDDTGEDMPF